MQNDHNIFKNTTKTEYMEISTNNESDNNDTNVKIDKIGVENSFMWSTLKNKSK